MEKETSSTVCSPVYSSVVVGAIPVKLYRISEVPLPPLLSLQGEGERLGETGERKERNIFQSTAREIVVVS